MLQWLIESGIDLTVRNSQGKRAVDVARRYGNKSCVKVLGGNPGTRIDESLLLCYFFVVVALTVSVLHGHHFFHPRHNGHRPMTLNNFHSRCYPSGIKNPSKSEVIGRCGGDGKND